VVIQVQENWC